MSAQSLISWGATPFFGHLLERAQQVGFLHRERGHRDIGRRLLAEQRQRRDLCLRHALIVGLLRSNREELATRHIDRAVRG